MEIANYVGLLFLWLISAIFLQILLKTSRKVKPNFPPSPPALPLIGHLHLLSPNITECFRKISSKYGPFVYLCLGSRPLVIVSSAEFASEIYKTHDVTFSQRPKTPFDDTVLFGRWSFLTAPYGEYWRFMKKLCMTELLGAGQLKRSYGVRCEELAIFLEKLLEKARRKESLNLGLELMKLTNNTMCRMVMSTRCSKEDDEAERWRKVIASSIDLAAKMAATTMLGPFKKFGYWLNRKQSEAVPKEYDELFDKILKEHEVDKDNDSKDLMDVLLKVYHDTDSEFKISKQHIKSFLLDLFIGGSDTSGNTMEWVMAELIKHPNIMKKLRNEIESVVGTNRLVEESDIQNLHYLGAVVKETMRLHPIVAVMPRECREDCKIKGYDIPKDTAIIINPYSIMRDPDIWERPNEFCPERFLQEHDNATRHNASFVTFGGGRRTCPGSHFALCIMHITIASMVQCFDWKVEEKVNMDEKAGMVASKAYPLVCYPVLRFHPFAT